MASLLCFSFLIGLTASTLCDIRPFQLPIRDVQVLSNVSDSFMRGIPVSVGNPPQKLVILPWAELNNTWLYDEQGYCDDTVVYGELACLVRRGNFFNEDNSETFQAADDITIAGGAPIETREKGAEAGIDKLIGTSLGGIESFDVSSTGPLNNFPIGVPRQQWDFGYTTLHALGLGTNSTYLNSLLKAGRISSRVWSIFWGQMGASQHPMEGSLVIGGYDQKKVVGNNFTQPLDFTSSGCWTGMKVIISDIKLNSREGGEQSLFPSNTAFPVCIVPQRQLLLEAPRYVLDNFDFHTKTRTIGPSYGLHWSASKYEKSEFFDGDITFELSSGLTIRIPNDQFMVPYVTIGRNGSRVFNESERELLIFSVNDQPATLGRYFLTSAYLMVDHDAHTFTMWRANPSTSSQLISVLDEETAATCSNVSDSIAQPSLSVGVDERKKPSRKLQPARIAGIVIGSIFGLSVAVGAIILIRKRKVRPASAVAPPEKSHSPLPPQEMATSADHFNEVEGSRHFVYEM